MERLSPHAMMLISQARQEAKRSGNQLVGTEHVLLSLMQSEDARVREVFSQCGLNEDVVRRTAHEISLGNRLPHDRDDLDFTPRVHRMIAKGFEEAELLGDTLIEPRHILIAMLRDDYGMASRILERTQVNTTTLLKSLLKTNSVVSEE